MFFFFFYSPRFLRDPSTDRPETFPHNQNLAVFYKLTSKIRGVLPKKIWGPKICKISVNFGPLPIWPRISPERGNISKIGKTYELGKLLLRLTKKVRWTLVHKRLGITCEFRPTKMHFLAYYISALRRCCALKISHALEIDQTLIAHTPVGAGVPPKKF